MIYNTVLVSGVQQRDSITSRVYHTKSERERQVSYRHLLHVETKKKNDASEFIYKTEIDSQTWETAYG